jgi:hypothetical protein
MSLTLQLYDRARAAIAARGFDAETQTKISLFVGAAKNVNAAILGAIELQPQVTVAYPFVHGQYYRELEFASLLARVTRWSANPALYATGSLMVAPLWREWWRIQLPAGPMFDARAAYTALALGHALLAKVRLAPVIAEGVDELDAFVAAVRRIEQENGRMIQAQIRLLKDAPSPLSLEDRERIIEAEQDIIEETFCRFLEWLGEGASAVHATAARPRAG